MFKMDFFYVFLRSAVVVLTCCMASLSLIVTVNALPFSKQSESLQRGTARNRVVLHMFQRSSTNATCNLSIESKSKEKFLAYINQANVEVIYLHMVFLNESKQPSFGNDISSVYDPLVWAWSANDEGNAILSLPYEYKVLSCSTLSRETRRLTLPITSQPQNCLENMRPEQQFVYTMNLLTGIAKVGSVNSSICHRFVDMEDTSTYVIYQSKTPKGFSKIKYKCCAASSHKQVCTMEIMPNRALSFILTFLFLVSCIAGFFTPLLIGYLPEMQIGACNLNGDNQLFEMTGYDNDGNAENAGTSGDNETGRQQKLDQSDYIPLNSHTPLGNIMEACSRCVCLCPGLFPRLSRFFLFFLVIPIFLLVALVSYSYVLHHEISLQKHADIKTDFVQMCLNPDPFLVSRIIGYFISCLLLCVPFNLVTIVDESVILVANLNGEDVHCCLVCAAIMHEQASDEDDDDDHDHELIGYAYLYDNMVRHMKFPFKFHFWKILFCISCYPARWLLHILIHGERISSTQPLWKWEETYFVGQISYRVILGTALWLLVSPVWLLGFICLALFIVFLTIPVGYFYACICFVPFVYLVQNFGISILTWLAFPAVLVLNSLSALFLMEVMTFSCGFLLKLIGFTLMGLVVNVDYYIPYVVYVLAVIFYIQNFFKTLNDRYLKLKVLVFDECLKQQNSGADDQTNKLVIRHSKTELPMIPRKLYEEVCKEHMPLTKTVSSNLFNLLIVILFLSFAFASIMAFGKWAKIPSLTEAIVTAFLSTLPKLMRYQGKDTGKTMLKQKKLLYSIEVQVVQYARMLRDGNPSEQQE